MEHVKLEASAAEEQNLLYEQSDLRIEVVELTRLAAIKVSELTRGWMSWQGWDGVRCGDVGWIGGAWSGVRWDGGLSGVGWKSLVWSEERKGEHGFW